MVRQFEGTVVRQFGMMKGLGKAIRIKLLVFLFIEFICKKRKKPHIHSISTILSVYRQQIDLLIIGFFQGQN